MKTFLPVLFFLTLPALTPSPSSAEPSPEEVLVGIASRFDPVPWAGNRFATAVLTAPAWIALEERPEIEYGQLNVEGVLDRDNLLSIRSRGFGFATESFHAAADRKMRRYIFVLSRRMGEDLATAVSFGWTTSKVEELDDLTSWDVSVAWRPHWRVELAGTGRNLARTDYGPIELGRFYEGGARVILIDRKVTGFAQARRFPGDGFGDIEPVFGAEYFPRKYLALRGRTDQYGNRGLGIEFIFDTASIGFHYKFSDGEEEGSFAYAKLHVPRGR